MSLKGLTVAKSTTTGVFKRVLCVRVCSTGGILFGLWHAMKHGVTLHRKMQEDAEAMSERQTKLAAEQKTMRDDQVCSSH